MGYLIHDGTNRSDNLSYSDLYGTEYYIFYMKGGNDYVNTFYEYRSYIFDGGAGSDKFFGYSADDLARGGQGNDTLYGFRGSDELYGNDGNDSLYGGSGIDYLNGGHGRDKIETGDGKDLIVYEKGDSNSTHLSADFVSDWNGSYDYLDTLVKGTQKNYVELQTRAAGIDAAKHDISGKDFRSLDHVFLFNPDKDIGFVLSDLDKNGSFETGVILSGAGSASDMSWNHLI